MTDPDWLPTAKALAALEDCPALSLWRDMGAPVEVSMCKLCGCTEPPEDGICLSCYGSNEWASWPTYPNAGPAYPDLSSDANGGVLLVAFWKVRPLARPENYREGYVVVYWHDSWDSGPAGEQRAAKGSTLAHAAALARLAVAA